MAYTQSPTTRRRTASSPTRTPRCRNNSVRRMNVGTVTKAHEKNEQETAAVQLDKQRTSKQVSERATTTGSTTTTTGRDVPSRCYLVCEISPDDPSVYGVVSQLIPYRPSSTMIGTTQPRGLVTQRATYPQRTYDACNDDATRGSTQHTSVKGILIVAPSLPASFRTPRDGISRADGKKFGFNSIVATDSLIHPSSLPLVLDRLAAESIRKSTGRRDGILRRS